MSVRVLVRTVSELCITIGTLIVLFVVYVLFWTGVKADSEMNHQIDQLQKQWSKGSVAQQSTAPATTPATGNPKTPTARTTESPKAPGPYAYGEAFAVMYIPRLGFTWNKPVLEGTGTSVPQKGLGHYRGRPSSGRRGTSPSRGTGARTATRSRIFPSCAGGRGGADRRDDLVHVSDRQRPLQNSAHGR